MRGWESWGGLGVGKEGGGLEMWVNQRDQESVSGSRHVDKWGEGWLNRLALLGYTYERGMLGR